MKTMKKVFLILLVTLAVTPLFAQSAIDTFVQKVEEAGDLATTAQAVDGGFVTVSRVDTTSFVVRKIKVSGQRQWERRLNFEVDGDFADIKAAAQTTDGGFVLAGQEGCHVDVECGLVTTSAILIKLRPNGTILWKKSFQVSGVGFDYLFSSVSATSDGGVIATGRRLMPEFDLSPRLFIARFTATGDIVWEKSFGTLLDSFFGPSFVIHSTATSDNGLIVAFSILPGLDVGSGFQVMKITNAGNIVWQKLLSFGAFGFQSVGATFDGGAILVSTATNSKKLKVVVLKPDGRLNWKAEYSVQLPGKLQFISSPAQTPDGGFVITGSTGFIAKIDSSRKVAFQHTFEASGKSVFATLDGGFFLFGTARKASDIVVLKLNSEGNIPGCDFFGSPGSTTRTDFGALRISGVNITESNDLSFEAADFVLTSTPTNHRVSTVCQ